MDQSPKSAVLLKVLLVCQIAIDLQESSLVGLVVRKLLANYITRPRFALNAASYDIFSEGNQPGVLQRVGSAAGM